MVYECEHCGYSTIRKYDLERHKNRKNPCHKIVNDDDNINARNNLIAPNINPIAPNINPIAPNINPDAPNINLKSKDNICIKCNKQLSSKYNLKKHILNCKGVDNLSCYKCKKVFSSFQGKHKHMKNVNCELKNLDNQIINNNGNINTNINNTNIEGDNIGTQNNININVFGNEDLSYLINDHGFFERLRQFGKKGVYGLANIISDVHCNNKRLENNNIIKPDEHGDGVYIMGDDEEWEFREFEDIKEELIKTISKYIKYYNDERLNFNVEYRDIKEKRFLRTLFYFAMALECDVPDDLFEDLEMDDENVEEDEDKLGDLNRKFDKATMRKIHENTYYKYKKERGKFIRRKIKYKNGKEEFV